MSLTINNMKNYLVFIPFLFFVTINCKIEKNLKESSVEKLIGCITSNSFYVVTNYGEEVVINDSCSKKLILLANKATKELKKFLSDSSKTIISHLILTKIKMPKKFFINKIEPTYTSDSIFDHVNYEFNNLTFRWYREGYYTIDKSEKNKIISYWK